MKPAIGPVAMIYNEAVALLGRLLSWYTGILSGGFAYHHSKATKDNKLKGEIHHGN